MEKQLVFKEAALVEIADSSQRTSATRTALVRLAVTAGRFDVEAGKVEVTQTFSELKNLPWKSGEIPSELRENQISNCTCSSLEKAHDSAKEQHQLWIDWSSSCLDAEFQRYFYM